MQNVKHDEQDLFQDISLIEIDGDTMILLRLEFNGQSHKLVVNLSDLAKSNPDANVNKLVTLVYAEVKHQLVEKNIIKSANVKAKDVTGRLGYG